MSFYCSRGPQLQAHNRQQLEVWLEANCDVRNQGKDEWNLVCPFHQSADTSRPDMWVNVEKGVFNCLSSSCAARGSAAELVRRLQGGSWEDARRQLGRPGGEALSRLLDALHAPVEASLSLSWDLIQAHRSANYWAIQRGLLTETQDHFHLGYDFERDHALIPYLDEMREPVGFIRRQMIGHPRYLYPTGFSLEQSVYHLYDCNPQEPLIVVEGSVDCMNVWQAGFRNVVALLGSQIPPQKARMFRHYQVISFLDADPAGVKGTWDLRASMGRIIQRVNYPESLLGSDPGSLTSEQIHACLGRLSPVI